MLPKTVKNFLQQFNPSSSPSPTAIVETWRRLLGDQQNTHIQTSIHPKPLVMAVLYMLHLESSLDVAKPRREDNSVGVDRNRREALKRFAKWVPCQCERSCGREWNFVNEIGMCRGGKEGRECGVLKLFERASWRNLLANKEMAWLMETRERWEAA